MANSIVKEREVGDAAEKPLQQGGARGKVVADIMGDISAWRKLRDGDYEALWDEYYAKWRGFWMPQHKNYKTERSKLIAPLTSLAVDLTTAEIVEGMFGREYFIDLPDDPADEEKADMEIVRKNLVNDLKRDGFIKQFGLIALNGALYGNGICKIQVDVKTVKKPYRTQEGKLVAKTEEEVLIKPVAIEPGQFVADPTADDIDMMKGCAHEFYRSKGYIKRKQNAGLYYNDVVVGTSDSPQIAPNRGDTPEGNRRKKKDMVFITEYYGEVPTRLFLAATAEANG